jgi:hypothetical protein
VCPGTAPGTPHRAARASADTEGLLPHHAEAGLLVLLVRLVRLLAEPAAPLLALLALLALLTLLALLALLLDQRHDRGRQHLLHGLFHHLLNPAVQRTVQCDSQERMRMMADALLLELLLDLLELLERVLQPLGDLLARLLAGLLHRLLNGLSDLLARLRTELVLSHLRTELLQRLTTGHDRHVPSTR